MKGKQPKVITHEEVQAALQKFQSEGGLITHLPDQVAPRNVLVGGKWGVYEPIADTSSGAEPSA